VDQESKSERLSNIHYYMSDPEVPEAGVAGPRQQSRMACRTETPGHRALAALERM